MDTANGVWEVKTEFSTYEIDYDLRRVRRLESIHEPTPRQGPDGVWKEFLHIRHVGDGLLFIWEIDEVEGRERCTYTSAIVSSRHLSTD